MSRPSEEQLRLKKEREEAEEAAEEAMDDYEDCLQMNRPKEERLEALLQVRDTKRRQLEANGEGEPIGEHTQRQHGCCPRYHPTTPSRQPMSRTYLTRSHFCFTL